MVLPDYFRNQNGTPITFTSSGGTLFTFSSITNNSARQSDKVDLGATRAEIYRVSATFEFATAPTAGNTIDLYWGPSASATAGTDNPEGLTGADGAYTGISSNLTECLKGLTFIGSFICTANATATIQAANVARFSPDDRYGILVAHNRSGVTTTGTAANQKVVFSPIIGVVEDT